MPFKQHLENTLKFDSAPTPIPRMVLCSICTTLPLIAGYALNQLPIAIFGGLFGFVLILNDHFGPLRQRIYHLIATFILLNLAFFLGIEIAGNIPLIAMSLFIISFILGKAKDFGVELERLLLFMSLQLITAAGSAGLKPHFVTFMLYCTFAFINYIICLTLVFLFSKHKTEFVNSKRKTFKKIINQSHSTRFAIIFSITITLGYLLANYFKISKGYWVIGTTLIVMLPNSTLSFYKSAQRLLGTFIGVIIAAFLVTLGHDPITLIIFVLIAAYFAPLGLIRNYWLGNLFIAALIMFLLEISSPNIAGSFDLAMLRATDIALGCLLGVVGSLINDPAIIFSSKKT